MVWAHRNVVRRWEGIRTRVKFMVSLLCSELGDFAFNQSQESGVAGPRFEPTEVGGGEGPWRRATALMPCRFRTFASCVLPLLIAHEISLQEIIHSLISSENSLFRCIGNFPVRLDSS
jgi:hypothetical protein